ncbi:sulfur carrier protein ThiS [Metaclostridioides mangenotii]|uniref:sulfur carrier protein ThiS n=1 Tax=Metaclostridioides mangenotii TaxID=1540 RepID=UPI000486A14B|nr:sulfur carrier protein ThiS [Clostridioides mangenotii]
MKVNGKDVEFKVGTTILDILESYKLDKNTVVVEMNFDILEEELYSYIVDEEDIVEIISFVGGG